MRRTILFDLDDTLCDDSGQMVRCIEEVAVFAARFAPGVGPAALVAAYKAISDRYWTYEICLTTPLPLRTVRERLWRDSFAAVVPGGLPESVIAEAVALYGRLREETPALFPETHPALEALLGQGCRLGVVTNGLSETHRTKLERLGLTNYFSLFLMPDVTGFAKPDPRQFHLACAQLGSAPEETTHVGDSLSSDVHGAVSAGLEAVWFNPRAHPLPADATPPHRTIRSLVEL